MKIKKIIKFCFFTLLTVGYSNISQASQFEDEKRLTGSNPFAPLRPLMDVEEAEQEAAYERARVARGVEAAAHERARVAREAEVAAAVATIRFSREAMKDLRNSSLSQADLPDVVLLKLLRCRIYVGPEKPHIDALREQVRAERAAVGVKAKRKPRRRSAQEERVAAAETAANTRAMAAKTAKAKAATVRVVKRDGNIH